MKICLQEWRGAGACRSGRGDPDLQGLFEGLDKVMHSVFGEAVLGFVMDYGMGGRMRGLRFQTTSLFGKTILRPLQ